MTFECHTCDRTSASPFSPDHTVTCALRVILAELEALTDLIRESGAGDGREEDHAR